jgi:hypothetical protein
VARTAAVRIAAAIAAAAPFAVLAPMSPQAREVLQSVIVTVATGVLAVAIRRRRPPSALPWWLLCGGLVAFDVRTWLFAAVRLEVAGPQVLRPLDIPLFLLGYALTVAGCARYVRLRVGGRDTDGLIDAAIVGCAAAVVVKEWLVPQSSIGDATSLALYVVMEAVVVAIAVPF